MTHEETIQRLIELSVPAEKAEKMELRDANLRGANGLTAHQLALTLNLENTIMDPGRYADAVAAGYKPKTE